jgi:hypothetical protein
VGIVNYTLISIATIIGLLFILSISAFRLYTTNAGSIEQSETVEEYNEPIKK